MKEEEFKNIHRVGIKGLLFNYPLSRDIVILPLSLIISLIITIIVCNYADPFIILNEVLSILFSTIPTILGFLVAGFALMFGFGDKSFFKKASKIKGGKSLYLSNVHAFSFALFVMIFTLMLMSIIQILTVIPTPLGESTIGFGINISIFILLFLLFYSLFLIYHAVKNVFNLTVTHHAYLNSEKDTNQEEGF